MLVFGDHDIEMTCDEVLRRFARRLGECDSGGIDEARVRLVLAGQIEQAILDAGIPEASEPSAKLTAAAARTFVAARRGDHCERLLHPHVDAVARALRGTQRLAICTPEGYAWYALYPDGYVQAAAQWASSRPASSVLIAGVRSIGTSLAAVVAAELERRGWQTATVTVRPEGHPFARTARLPPGLPQMSSALVVDEGPGLSGSSMASVAEALAACGYGDESIALLSGHGNGPGRQSSTRTRALWSRLSHFATEFDALEWHDGVPALRILEEVAAAQLTEALSVPLRPIGAGAWCAAPHETPSLALALERPKFVARGRSGRNLLLKYAGFSMADVTGPHLATSVEQQLGRIAKLAAASLTPAPLTQAHGWIVTPWIEGRRLSAADATQSLLRRIAAQITAAALPPLQASTRERSFSRLVALFSTNTRELLGEVAADRAAHATDRLARELVTRDLPAYGDGRLAPCEWLETPAGVVKVDAGGHECDHTIVGSQPILWDVAGAIVEWNMCTGGRDAMARIAGLDGSSPVVAWYCAVYAAFRAGVAVMFDAHEAAARFYRLRLWRELSRLPAS